MLARLKANEEAVKKLEEAKEQIEILSKEKVEWKNKFDDQAMILWQTQKDLEMKAEQAEQLPAIKEELKKLKLEHQSLQIEMDGLTAKHVEAMDNLKRQKDNEIKKLNEELKQVKQHVIDVETAKNKEIDGLNRKIEDMGRKHQLEVDDLKFKLEE